MKKCWTFFSLSYQILKKNCFVENFGKLIRSSGNKFGVRETNSEFGENFFFDFFPSYRSNLKKIKTCWVLEMSLFLIFDGKKFENIYLCTRFVYYKGKQSKISGKITFSRGFEYSFLKFYFVSRIIHKLSK